MYIPALKRVGKLKADVTLPHIRLLLTFKIGNFNHYNKEILKLGKELLAISMN